MASTLYLLQNEMEEGDVIYSTSPYLISGDSFLLFRRCIGTPGEEELERKAFQRWGSE